MQMKSKWFSRGLLSAVSLAALSLISCGGSTSSAPPPPPPAVSVSISPSSVNVPAGETQSFTAVVTGSTNTAVTWSVREGAAGGAINSSGVYLAPSAFGTYHVVATSQADPTKSGTATVTVAPVSVTISPGSVGMRPSGTQSFRATVTGSRNLTVTWTVQEGSAGGTITDAGLYTAPTALGTYHVIATSVADPSKNATATVAVLESGLFRPVGDMRARAGETATLLPNGQVFVAGGGIDWEIFPIAELFDPLTERFISTASTQREYHSATLLQNGKVLLAGGFDRFISPTGYPADGSPVVTATAELYDPATGTFTSTGSMTKGRAEHTATLLPNGKVLVVGDDSTAEIYDPAAGIFTLTGSMAKARIRHTATLLPNGKVLVAGGGSYPTYYATAEVYDPATGTFAPTGSMANARTEHTATLLPNGKVLVAGGSNAGTTAELYDPSTASFTLTGSLVRGRSGHHATLLRNGSVLVTGGEIATAEVYE